MSRYMWTPGDRSGERWHVGWDRTEETYFAQMEPRHTPVEGIGMNSGLPREGTVWEGLDDITGCFQRVRVRRNLSDSASVVVLDPWPGWPGETLIAGEEFGIRYRWLPDDPRADTRDQVVDVAGIKPGEVSTVGELQDRLRERVQIPDDVLRKLTSVTNTLILDYHRAVPEGTYMLYIHRDAQGTARWTGIGDTTRNGGSASWGCGLYSHREDAVAELDLGARRHARMLTPHHDPVTGSRLAPYRLADPHLLAGRIQTFRPAPSPDRMDTRHRPPPSLARAPQGPLRRGR